MRLKTQIFIAVIIIIALCIVINMIRKKALELRYALSWMLLGIGVLILDLCPSLMNWVSVVLGIKLPINMLFFMGFCFTLIIMIDLTFAVSKMSVKIKELTQEIALYQKEDEEDKAE